MSSLLLNLRHVPDDEVEEITQLLDAEGIAWYQTPSGRWGISAGGIWLKDPQQQPRARALLADYQHSRAERARREWDQAVAAGTAPRLIDALRADPLGMLVRAVAILLMLGMMLLLPLSLL